ncbi:lanthionine synthetase C family protein [Lysinibacillus sphaericus]|uniref:lanthionine synthetase C family protein n=1 Tax=Lysinibacillus sphaericus TaxID=1421 RepID=UPI003D763D84
MNFQKEVFKYSEQLGDIEHIIKFSTEEFNTLNHSMREIFYNHSYYDIANGLLGNCIFLSEMYKKTNDLKYHQYAHKILKIGINRKGIESIDNPGLWSGLSGVCFCLETLNNNGLYKEIIKSCDQILIVLIQKKIDEANENLNNHNVMMGDYDLMEGLVGIAQYILTYKVNNSHFQLLLSRIVDYFISLTQYQLIKDKKIPNWLIKSENQFLEEEKRIFSNGNFNQGVSHGICGVFICLINIYKQYKEEKVKTAIEALVDWFLQTKIKHNNYYVWEKKLMFEQLNEDIIYNEKQINLSWCYGDFMIIYALSEAADTLNNHELKFFVDKSLEEYDRSGIEIDLLSPTLCHGYAGTLLILKKLQLKKNTEVLQRLYLSLYEKLKLSYDEQSKFGFTDIEEYLGNKWSMNKYSLLSGNSGIYLTLLFLEHGVIRTKWDALFLLDAK